MNFNKYIKPIIFTILVLVLVSVGWFYFHHKNKQLQNIQTIGSLVFHQKNSEFNSFVSLYFSNNDAFLKKYHSILSGYSETNNLTPIHQYFLAFGEYNNELLYFDWLGEESEKELEVFIKQIDPSIRTTFPLSNQLRNNIEEELQIDTAFFKQLFVLTDQDLMAEKKQLLFVKNDWNGYVVTVVKQSDFKKLSALCSWFYSSSDLKGIIANASLTEP